MTEETLAAGLRLGTVLILEDEALVSLLIEDIVRDLGAQTVHLFGDADEAREAAQTATLDCAILDVMVRGGNSHEIADILDGRGVPFIFSTGSGGDGIPQQHRHRPVVAKPFADADIRNGLAVALGAQPAP